MRSFRDLRTALDLAYEGLPPNGRLSLFANQDDRDGSIARPLFETCKPAATPGEQEAIGAPNKTAPHLARIAKEAKAAYQTARDHLLADAANEAKSALDSPILSQLQAVSRYPGAAGWDALHIVTDGIENSEIAQFCSVQGDMPSFAKFAQKPVYDFVQPAPYTKTDVSLLLVETGVLPSRTLAYCSNDELRRWWPDYFKANRAHNVELTRLRPWSRIMNSFDGYNRGRLLPAILVGAAAWYVLQHTGPIMRGSEINGPSAFAAFFLAVAGFAGLADLFWIVARLADGMSARLPSNLKGSAAFVRSLREIKGDLIAKGWGPYWGVLKGKPIFADYASNALTLGPAGTGKGIGVVIPMVLAIRASKTIVDFKGELSCMLVRALRKRGETVRILNLGNLFEDILGPGDHYNPSNIIADDFFTPGGLRDVSDDAHEMNMQLLPDAKNAEGGRSENSYFDSGSRTFLSFGNVTTVLIDGYDATLGHVADLLSDRQKLLKHAQWACGRLKKTDDNGKEVAVPPMPIADSPWASLHDPGRS